MLKDAWAWSATILTPIGELALSASEQGLSSVEWGASPRSDTLDPFGYLGMAIRWFEVYFDGVEVLRPPLDLGSMTPFQRAVIAALLDTTQFGRTITYGALALSAGSKNAARAVGSVMAAQPLPIIVPCHRVLPANGLVGRYSGAGGSETKEWLLGHEQR